MQFLIFFICGLDPDFAESFIQATSDATTSPATPMVAFGAAPFIAVLMCANHNAPGSSCAVSTEPEVVVNSDMSCSVVVAEPEIAVLFIPE